MARLKLSPSGLRSPLDLSVVPAPADIAPADDAAPRAARLAPAPDPADLDATSAGPDAAPTATAGSVEAPAPAPAPAAPAAPAATPAPAQAAPRATTHDAAPAAAAVPEAEAPSPADATAPADATLAADAAPAATPTQESPRPTAVADGDVPAWAVDLERAALAPDRLLGRPKQTALILDRELSSRADALVAATGPRVTFAALVTAILHFHLPADGEAAARAIGGYRRRKLETLDRPWEERNARLPEPLRAELDDVVAGATGRVASVRRSTLVNALLDAHLPADADDASRLVVRMEMVRGGAFLDLVA